MHRRDLNFLSYHRGLRLLQAATFAAVVGSLGMVSFFVYDSSLLGRATISDTLASASFSALPSVTVPTQTPVSLSENAIVAAANDPSGKGVRFYERDTGKAFSVALVSRRTDVLSDQRLPGFIGSAWVPGSRTVISSFQKPEGIEYRFFDYDTKQSAVISGDNIADVRIAPDGSQIAIQQKTSADTTTVSLAAIDGSSRRTLFSTRADELRMSWRIQDSLSIITRRNDRVGYDLSLVDLSGSFSVVLKNKENLEAAWSPDGAYLLYSYFVPEQGISLWLRSLAMNEEVPLGIGTSASKCAWLPVGYVVACGVPMEGALSRDVPANKTATIDDILVFDFDATTYRKIHTGAKGSLLSISDPFISSSGRYLLFTNTFDSRLYSVPL